MQPRSTAATSDRPAAGRFTTGAGGTATARFMHCAGYRYVTAGGWTAVALPYRGGRLTMTALLPPAGRAALRCQVPPAAALRIMDTALARTGPTVAIALPKVSLVTHQDMKGLLTLLGMGIAFDRPYLMLVTDAETGEPLFFARVANPGR